MKVLIAGGTGFVGQALVDAWHSEKAITVLGRDANKIRSIFSEKVIALTWDDFYSDPQQIAAVLAAQGQQVAIAGKSGNYSSNLFI